MAKGATGISNLRRHKGPPQKRTLRQALPAARPSPAAGIPNSEFCSKHVYPLVPAGGRRHHPRSPASRAGTDGPVQLHPF